MHNDKIDSTATVPLSILQWWYIFNFCPPTRFASQVSLRKQEIADRLNAWIIFNEKNKELCEWLTQMENKVAHNSDLNIEEMVEKLKKVSVLTRMYIGNDIVIVTARPN